MTRKGDHVEIEAVIDKNIGWQGNRLRFLSALTWDSTEYLCLGANVIGTKTESLMSRFCQRKAKEKWFNQGKQGWIISIAFIHQFVQR